MNKKLIIQRWVCVLLLITVCFLLQTTVFAQFELAGVTPNFIIIVVSTFGFTRGSKEGLIVGFICGLLMDIFFGSILGAYALLYMYIGFMNGFFRKIFFGDDIKLPLVLIGGSDLAYGIIIYIALFLFRHKYHFAFYLLNIIIPEVIYTVIVSIPVYYVILKINQKLEKSERRSTRTLV